ncbi:iron-sulfur cluster insertion protein ErpA [Cohaesibacter gelatinilyticus]|uniref:Iron-sulfur cluster assembly accessory protein n=1 Tax=Cohaesibacter gelatinilyticus TaxID=372072 RepID=A0A285NJD9_9HYPH|nr:iron-sulfur cluster insertion protein ErpA [Cohaesibacter gelatinilyticus]SNZ07761.1 Iron-sulfur cluster assembly accessory protein [Cohaesibacter gelatinilyticus]HAT84532.1 iron-sulfur cluster insertion protein ErpA [Hyphomicrobiales bacterium]
MTNAMTPEISVTESAMKRIATILSKEDQGTMLRISVSGGGCSGFQYNYDLTKDSENDDMVIERDGAVVLIDPMTQAYMEGSQVDFVDDVMGQSFQITNPQATASCGCGTSFAI